MEVFFFFSGGVFASDSLQLGIGGLCRPLSGADPPGWSAQHPSTHTTPHPPAAGTVRHLGLPSSCRRGPPPATGGAAGPNLLIPDRLLQGDPRHHCPCPPARPLRCHLPTGSPAHSHTRMERKGGKGKRGNRSVCVSQNKNSRVV